MRQNNISAQKNITHSAVAYSPACGKITQTRRIFFLYTFNPGFQIAFEPFLRILKYFHIQKGFKAFQSSRNWFKNSEKQIGLVMGIRAVFTCFQHFRPQKRDFPQPRLRLLGITTVFVDTRLWKTKHQRKRFQNFRQSYV